MSARQVDAFDGIYDNTQTKRRELWRDGELRTYFARGVNAPLAKQFGMVGPWGHFPDFPHAAEAATTSESSS